MAIEKNSCKIKDYNCVKPPFLNEIVAVAGVGILAAVIVYIFYRLPLMSLCMLPVGLIFLPIYRRSYRRKRKEKLRMQFKDLLYMLSTALCAGKSIEHSFSDALEELYVLYPDESTDIIQEVKLIIFKLSMNISVEDCLKNLANRTHIDDIENFSDIFSTCHRTSGNISQVIKSSANMIADKITIREDINTMLAEKKLEFYTVMIMPIASIEMFHITVGSYMDPLFTTAVGRIVMTVALLLTVASYLIGKRIIEIEV